MFGHQIIYGLILSIVITTFVAPVGVFSDEKPNDILVVVNLKVKETSLSLNELRAIFLKKKTAWKSGGKVVAIHSSNTTLRSEFSNRVLGFSLDQEKAFWQDAMIRNGTRSPPSFDANLKAAFKIEGAITYIYRHQYKAGVVRIILELK